MTLEQIIDRIRQHPRLVVTEDFEIVAQKYSNSTTKFHNGEKSFDGNSNGWWISLRLTHRKQPGRSTTFLTTKEALENLVDDAFESAQFSSPDPWFRFPIFKEAGIEPEEKESSLSATDSLFGTFPQSPKAFEELYEQSEIEERVHRKTEKQSLHSKQRMSSYTWSLLRSAQKDHQWLKFQGGYSGDVENQEDVNSLWNLAEQMEGAEAFNQNADLQCIWDGSVTALLLKKIAPWFYADRVQQGRSFLSNVVDQPLFSKELNLVDDGRRNGGLGTRLFDVEGTPSQKVDLVKQGNLNSFLYDTYTATRENKRSTGHLNHRPGALSAAISHTNLFIEAGPHSMEKLLSTMDRGVLLRGVDFLDPVSGHAGEFVLQGYGWRVRAGKLENPLREILIHFNALDLLRRVAAVGEDLRFYNLCGAPSILFESLPLEGMK